MKLCKDCKFYKIDWMSPFTGRFAKCSFNDEVETNLVTGRNIVNEKRTYCSIERKYEENCGVEAKNFQPRG